MYSASATETGTAISIPITEVSSVPYTNCRIPYGFGLAAAASASDGAHR